MNPRFERIKSVSDIVEAMIHGLDNEWVKVNMSSYGGYYMGVCYGCAATNTLCEVMADKFRTDDITNRRDRAERFNYGITYGELSWFEGAIDWLRRGSIVNFIEYLSEIKHLFSFKLPMYPNILPPYPLPILETENYKERLDSYRAYVTWLRDKGL